MAHLGVEDWQALLPFAQPAVLLHLIRCPRCRRRLDAVLSEPEPEATEGTPGSWPGLVALVNSLDFGIAQSLSAVSPYAAHALFDELTSLADEYRLEVLQTADRFHDLGLAELLLAAADEAASERPLRSHHLAAIAVAVLEHLEPTIRVRRRLATAYCLLGDADRRRGRLEIAADHLANGVHHLAHDPLLIDSRARLCLVLGHLRHDQRRTDEALALYDRSRRIAEELALDDLQAQAALAFGSLMLEEGEPEEALPLLWEAFHLAEGDSDPATAIAALHDAALASAESDRTDDLEKALAGLELLSERLQHPLDPLRFAWSRARIDWQRGDRPEALAALESVFLGLLKHPAPVEAARAAVELALRSLEADTPPDRLIPIADQLSQLAPELLPPPLAAVVNFALLLPSRAPSSFYMDALEATAAYLLKAQFDPEIRYFPLEEPDLTVSWDSVPIQLRRAAAKASAVALDSDGEARTTLDLHLVCWAHEALTGVRVDPPTSYSIEVHGWEDDTWPS